MNNAIVLPPDRALPVDFASLLGLRGQFLVEHWRRGRLLSQEPVKNLIVDVGLVYALGVAISGTAKISTWYIGLFETNYTPVAGDTLASLLASATECIAYDEAARPQFNGVQTLATITNSAARAEFTMNATKTVYGGFVTANSAKGGTTNVLWAAAKFSAPKPVSPTDLLRVRYDASVVAI